MADSDLDEIRAKRLAQLRSEYGVRISIQQNLTRVVPGRNNFFFGISGVWKHTGKSTSRSGTSKPGNRS